MCMSVLGVSSMGFAYCDFGVVIGVLRGCYGVQHGVVIFLGTE
jgi:hypothetical protein